MGETGRSCWLYLYYAAAVYDGNEISFPSLNAEVSMRTKQTTRQHDSIPFNLSSTKNKNKHNQNGFCNGWLEFRARTATQ